MPRTKYNFSIDLKTLELLRELADSDNRSVSNWLETMILKEYAKRIIDKK